MKFTDPIAEGLTRGWQVSDGASLKNHSQLDADVTVLGSGLDGVMAAAQLAKAGAKVVLLEEGALHSSRDFRLDERRAYAELYQDNGARQTVDKGVTVLQGRMLAAVVLLTGQPCSVRRC